MKAKFFIIFYIVSILLTATIILSFSTSQSILAQNNKSSTSMDAPNQNNMTSMGNQPMPMGNNYQNMNMGNKDTSVTGTINIFNTMYQSIASKFNVSLVQAITTAENSVGNNSYAMEAKTDVNNGYLVYSVILGSPDMKFYDVIVDPGSGQILSSFQLSMMDGIMMIHGWNNQDNGMIMGMKNGWIKNGHNNNQGHW
jgi:archaellum component FlaG (FlaF/FlaG flagellin family)